MTAAFRLRKRGRRRMKLEWVKKADLGALTGSHWLQSWVQGELGSAV